MQLFHCNHDKTRLLMFFAGFYTDNNCFAEFDNLSSDILYIYDYSALDFDNIYYFDFTPYTEINLIAYSYGVFAANEAYNYLPEINKSTAISGTIYPIDENFGIKPKIFDLMLNSFDENVVLNFKQKMEMNSNGVIKNSKRTIQSLKNELLTIKEYMQANKITENINFDTAILTKKDKIFPYSAQESFFSRHNNKITLDLGHFPFFYFENFDKILEL